MTDLDRTRNRKTYDAFIAGVPESERWQWQPPPWRLATPRERAIKVTLWVVESIGVAICIALGGLAGGMVAEMMIRTYNGS